MSLRHGLLGLLNYEPMTGYELDKEFKESLAHFWQAKPQQIYRELNAMEQNGWLTSERIPQEDKPNRRVYAITDKGKSEFLGWLSSSSEDIQSATRVKSVFLMRLFFAGEASREQAIELLCAYQEQCLVDIQKMNVAKAQLSQTDSLYDPDKAIYWQLIGMHGEMMRKTRLEWAKRAIAILENKGGGTNAR